MPLPEDFESRTATLTTPKTQASTHTTPAEPTLPGTHPQPPRPPRPPRPQPPHDPKLDPGPPKPPERPTPTFPETVPGGHWAWGMTPGGFGTTWVWDDPAPAPAPPQPPQPPPPPPLDPAGTSATTPAPTPTPTPRPTPRPTNVTPLPPQPPPPPPPPVDPGNTTIALGPDGTFARQIYKGSPKMKVRITYRGGGSKLTITVGCDGQTQTLSPQPGETIEVEGDDISISATGTWPQSANVDISYP